MVLWTVNRKARMGLMPENLYIIGLSNQAIHIIWVEMKNGHRGLLVSHFLKNKPLYAKTSGINSSGHNGC